MSVAANVSRRLSFAIAAALMALTLALAVPAIASAHGCGSTDHSIQGSNPPLTFEQHYFQYKWTARNSRFTKWLEIRAGESGFNSTWCGCVIQSQPCIH